MRRKSLYIIIILFSLIFASLSYEVKAVSPIVSIPAAGGVVVDDIFSGKNFANDTSGNQAIEQGTDLAVGIINNAIAIIQVVGLGIAIIMLFALGIKYMVGSVEDKAEVKKHAMVYVIGAVIFFAATAILEILQMFIQGNFKV